MSRLAAPSALAILLSGTAAFADVTAEEVWAELRGMLESYGQSASAGSQDRAGNTLTVRDITIDAQVEGSTTSAALDQIAFVERGDGSVEIVLSPEYRVISSTVADGETFEIQVAMRHSALSVVVSGDAAEKTYTYSAASIGAELTELDTGDGPAPITATVEVAQPAGSYVTRTEGNGRAVVSAFTASGAQIAVGGSDDDAGSFAFTMDLDTLEGQSDSFLPESGSMEDFAAFLRSGFFANGELSYGTSTYSFEGDMEGSRSAGTGQDEGGNFDFAFGAEGLSYGARSRNASFTMRSSDIPLPEIAFALEESAFRLTMPVLQSDTPQDFGLVSALRGLTVSDGIWALFDPMGGLPRDPATIALDLSGKARWFIDIFSAEGAEAAASGSAAPGEVSALAVNELEVSLVSADLTGTGDFTFDNADTTTFPGMPRPEGSADLRLVGGNALLDRLVEMGFVPEDQAMGFRMMLGLFARPGEGEDTLVSKIEITPEGQILANGQRIR